MEVKKAKKKSVGLFRSVSSLSTSSRRQETEPDRPVLERIRLSVGRRSVDDYSNHPINEIWNENENRQSPTNILEPVFDETPTVAPTAPPIETSDEEPTPTSHSNNEEEKELIEALKASSISSKSPSRASSIKVPVRLFLYQRSFIILLDHGQFGRAILTWAITFTIIGYHDPSQNSAKAID